MASPLRRYSVNKNPSAYEKYAFELSDLYRNVCKNQLKEQDEIRDKSLKEMRQWIATNPHIRKCRTDAKFLLRFLRFCQFSVSMACEALENYLALRQMYPTWYKNLDCTEAAMKKIFQNSYFYYLGQDSKGRSVVFFQFGRFDYQEFDAKQLTRFNSLMIETMLEWEEMQIGGCRVLIDYRGTTMEHCTMWNSTSLKIAVDSVSRAYPLRFEGIHSVNLPKFATPVVEVLLALASSNFREQIHCYSSIEEFTEQFEQPLKPPIYGGGIDLEKIKGAFWDNLEKHRDIVLGLDEMEIDIDYYASTFDNVNTASVDKAIMALFHQMGME